MKYYINETGEWEQVTENEFNDKLEDAIRGEVEAHYDDMIDDDYGPVEIMGVKFDAHRILQELDPVAYNLGIDDYVDYRLSDAKSDFESEYQNGYGAIDFKTVEELDDDEEI